jgi:hypothetical protein
MTGNDFVRPQVHRCQGSVAAARGDLESAKAALQRALDLYAAQGRKAEVAQVRCEIAAIDLHDGRMADALRAVDVVLAVPSPDGPEGYRQLPSDSLITCLRLLEASADARAAGLLIHLQSRLQDQLDHLPDDGARSKLLAVPHWAALRRRLDEGRPGAFEPRAENGV